MKRFGKKQKPENTEHRRASSSNPAVFSYYARGASPTDQNTGRADVSTKSSTVRGYRLRLGHIPSYIALLAIIIAFGYSLILEPTPKIVLASTPNTVHREPAVYQEAIEAIWKESVLNRTKPTVSTSAIREDITSQFTELADVQIELPLLGRRPTVILTPVQPALHMVSANGSFYVDSAGKVMARTTDLMQNELKDIPLIRDESGIPAELGKNIIPSMQTLFLRRLHAQLLAQNVQIESLSLPKQAANQVDVRVAGQPYYIKFSTETEPRQAVGAYLAAKAKLDREGTAVREYMDVRVDEKVFYK